MEYRIEIDSLGEIEVPADRYFGAQTMRSKHSFAIGIERMPVAVIHALAIIKKAAALTNSELGLLPKPKCDVICQVCDEILVGQWEDEFPLVIWQTGSGTQTNMNVNEVIANRAIELLGGTKGTKTPIHPNDDVNMSQSSNDTFPSAMHIAATLRIHNRLLPNLKLLRDTLDSKAQKFAKMVKAGRTHLMDAAPITLGQEISGWVSQLDHGMEAIEHTLPHLYQLALGGTAVGTGLNSHPEFASKAIARISQIAGFPFQAAPNRFEALAASDAIVEVSGALKRVAVSLVKIATDVRWLSSGPRCGLSEITIPINEAGSSIMPGKVNPTQGEALSMVCGQVIGNDVAITFGGSQGNFELNVQRPMMIHNLLQSIRLLADASLSFNNKCAVGIEPDLKRLRYYVEHDLMLATVLNKVIGYDKATEVVKKAIAENLSLREAVLRLGVLSEAEFDRIVDPTKMV